MNPDKKFLTACVKGNLKEVQELLPLVNPKEIGSNAVLLAAKNGHAAIVEYLLP